MTPDETDRVFAALADATRRDIVRRVIRDDQSVSALAERYPMSFAAVQKHVAVLERAQLVRKQRRGREQIVTSEISTLLRADRLLRSYQDLWRHRIDRIGDLLDDEQAHGPDDPPSTTETSSRGTAS